MKLTVFLILLTFVQLMANNSYAQKTKLSVDLKNTSIEMVLLNIENQSDFKFIYNKEKVDVDSPVSLQLKEKSINETLGALFEGKDVSYTFYGNQVILTNKSESESAPSQQQKSVSGKVTDSSGASLPGVSVVVKGTTTGVITDGDGKYTIARVSENATLQFSFVGMKTQEIGIGNKATINITLEDETIGLEEVVAIGYGTVKKSDLTGAVASVKSDEIKAYATSNVMQSLSGRAPGVQVTQNTGAPGGAVSVRIRGTNSIQGSNEPLYVIDGFPYSSSNPSVISNSDIESVEILKDASSTAIYGSRGANGVILITTKRGKSGKTTVDFESSYGIQKLRKKLDIMNAKEYAMFYNEQATNDKLTPYFTQDQINGFGEGYDWQDLVFVAAPIKNNTLSINGGNEKTKFSVSGNVFDQDGIITGSNYKKYSLRAFFTHEISKMLSLDYSATLTRINNAQQNSAGGGRGSTLMNGSISAPPTLTPYNDDGSYRILSTAYPFISNTIRNPLNFINEESSTVVANIVLANAALIFKPVEGLTLKIYGGIENNDSRTDTYTTRNFVNSLGAANVYDSNNLSLLNEITLSYNKTFNKKHNLSAVAGYTYQDFLFRSLGGSGTGFLTDVTETSNLASAAIAGIPSSSYSKSVLLSGLGRVNYSFNDKYLFTISVRADGSSKYSEGSKWAYFPSGAFAWKAKEENFLKDVDFITNLKLRSSFGYTGSQAIGAYATLNQLSSGKTVYGDAIYTTFAPGTTLPANLKWETTEQIDFGFDVSILNSRFGLSADIYQKTTRDLLNAVSLPSSLGYTRTIQNIGKIGNKGLELALDAKVLTGEFNWALNANIAFNRNKVIKLSKGEDILGPLVGDNPIRDNISILREGEPMSVFYGYTKNGYDAAGKEIYKDLSGAARVPDGVINAFDKQIIGDPNADFTYGLNSTMTFKGFELNLFFQGIQGNDLVNFSALGNTLDYGFGVNMTKEVFYNHWTPDNLNAKYPVLSRNYSYKFSDRMIEDGSFLRLRNVRFAYNLPLNNWGINGMREIQLYVSGQNLLTITKYSWYDPEVNSQGSPNSINQGLDYYTYPTTKSVTFGIKIGL